MTVEKLSDNRAIIILQKQDMQNFSLSFDTLGLNNLNSRKILLRIMRLACRHAGLDISGKSVSLEAIEVGEDCYILLTADKLRRKKYRRSNSVKSICYNTGSSSNFLEIIEKLYRKNIYCNKNSAYYYNGSYYIVFDYDNIPTEIKKIFSEYCAVSGGKTESARVRENGKKICGKNAVYQIGKHLV